MSHAAETFAETLTVEQVSSASDRMLGLAIAALMPALFWTVMLSLLGQALGFATSPLMLMSFAAAVAGFLALVVKALQANS